MMKYVMPNPPEPSYPAVANANSPSSSSPSAVRPSRHQSIAPLEAAFIKRTYWTLTWFTAILTFCAWSITHSALLAWSFGGGAALAGVLLKSQEMLVRRVVRPKDAPRYDGWDAALPLPLCFVLKYGILAAALWWLNRHHHINLIAIATGFMIAQFAVTTKVLARLLLQRAPSVRESYIERPLARVSHSSTALIAVLCLCLAAGQAMAQPGEPAGQTGGPAGREPVAAPSTAALPHHRAAAAEATKEEAEGEHKRGTFESEYGTWLHPVAQAIFHQEPAERHGDEFENVGKDFIVVAILAMVLLAGLGYAGGQSLKLRPEGKPNSLANIVEALVEAFYNYLVGVMGPGLAMKYAPLISTYFFTILFFNWMGLIPGLLAPTSNPNIPIAFAIISFFSVHFIALREAGFKSWIMHFVGEPIWLAPLNFPLHIIGEFIKPMSLAIRLLCNVFGEEMIVAKMAGLGLLMAAALHLPPVIPLQLPFMLLGVFFGFLQALVFSTLVAIYISILATHHDTHDEHNVHGHVEHVHVHGHDEVVAHPTETPVA